MLISLFSPLENFQSPLSKIFFLEVATTTIAALSEFVNIRVANAAKSTSLKIAIASASIFANYLKFDTLNNIIFFFKKS